MTISAAEGYTGLTTVNAGSTLNVTGSLAGGVTDNGILAGSGTVAGTVTVNGTFCGPAPSAAPRARFSTSAAA